MTRVTAAEPISLDQIRQLARGRFGDVVKAVVDLHHGVMLLDADMHADQEAELLGEGSLQTDLWASTSTRTSRVTTGWSSIR